MRRVLVVCVAAVMLPTACGGDQPASCDEVADEVIVLVQELIDQVEDVELGDDGLAAIEDLPGIDSFRERSEALDAAAADLGCAEEDLRDAVMERADELTSDTPVGELIIQGVSSGGL